MDPKKIDLNKFLDKKLIDKSLSTAREAAGRVKESTEHAMAAGVTAGCRSCSTSRHTFPL